MVWVGPKSNDGCSYKRKAEGDLRHSGEGRRPGKVEAETGFLQHKPGAAWVPEAGRGKGGLSLEPERGCDLALSWV